jgi:hypothetical protein
MSLSLTFTPTITGTETLETNVAFASDAQILHTVSALSLSLNGSSSPPVSKISAFQKALSGGSGSIDFTALPQAGGGTQDLTGLKPRFAILRNPSTNTGNITIADGASNGHNFFGDGSGQITLKPGQWAIHFFAGSADAVASGDRTIDLTGTGSEALDVYLVFGS